MLQAEYVLEEAYASYPEKHSVWDKLSVPTGTMTLEAELQTISITKNPKHDIEQLEQTYFFCLHSEERFYLNSKY